MNVLLTGASGFVGQNLYPFLEANGFVTMPLPLRGDWHDTFPSHYDATIHLAGKAHDTKNTSSAEEYFQINTELTKQVFERFLRSNARDFIYVSSVKAVVDEVNGALDENINPAPQTSYGRSKWLAEQYLNEKELPNGKRLFILRPCMIHGPGNKGNLNLLYQLVSRGIPWPLAAFENQRSFLSIDNLNYILKCILENEGIAGGTYNVADDESLSTNELIKLIGEVKGKKSLLLRVPVKLIKFVAILGDILHLPLNTERMKKLTESYVVDNRKIKIALQIERLPFTVREGLRKTIHAFSEM